MWPHLGLFKNPGAAWECMLIFYDMHDVLDGGDEPHSWCYKIRVTSNIMPMFPMKSHYNTTLERICMIIWHRVSADLYRKFIFGNRKWANKNSDDVLLSEGALFNTCLEKLVNQRFFLHSWLKKSPEKKSVFPTSYRKIGRRRVGRRWGQQTYSVLVKHSSSSTRSMPPRFTNDGARKWWRYIIHPVFITWLYGYTIHTVCMLVWTVRSLLAAAEDSAMEDSSAMPPDGKRDREQARRPETSITHPSHSISLT